MDSLSYLYDLNLYLHFLPIILGGGLLLLRRFPSFFLPIFLLCCVSSAADLVGSELADHHIHNLFVFHAYNAFDPLIIILFFQQSLRSDRFQKIIPVLFDCIGVFALCYSFSIGYERFPSYQIAVNTGVVVVLVLLFFYEVFYFESMENLSTDPKFWIASVLLLYYVGALAVHLMFEQTLSGYLSESIRYVNVILLILTHFVFTFTLWMGRIRTA